jgi:hypothetical protein
MISGSLNTPTVITLPMVVGTDTPHNPVSTTIGVIYGNRTSGIWLWPHGDTSQHLSPQMDPHFWVNDPVWGGFGCTFDRCDEWVLVPNSWIFDLNLKSWWRIEDPAVASIRLWTCLSQFIYGSESFYTNADPYPIHFWRRDGTPSSTYSWQSHPLWETVNSVVDLREITMRVSGTGTVVVTMTGENHTSTIDFTVSNAKPVLVRQPCRIQDANIAIRIEATGTGSPAIAPTVWELNCGYVEAQRERTST